MGQFPLRNEVLSMIHNHIGKWRKILVMAMGFVDYLWQRTIPSPIVQWSFLGINFLKKKCFLP
jgi:hypothetical protein